MELEDLSDFRPLAARNCDTYLAHALPRVHSLDAVPDANWLKTELQVPEDALCCFYEVAAVLKPSLHACSTTQTNSEISILRVWEIFCIRVGGSRIVVGALLTQGYASDMRARV